MRVSGEGAYGVVLFTSPQTPAPPGNIPLPIHSSPACPRRLARPHPLPTGLTPPPGPICSSRALWKARASSHGPQGPTSPDACPHLPGLIWDTDANLPTSPTSPFLKGPARPPAPLLGLLPLPQRQAEQGLVQGPGSGPTASPVVGDEARRGPEAPRLPPDPAP